MQNIKKSVVESTNVVNVKPSQDKGKAIAQIDNHEEKAREERKGDSTKVSKTWARLLAILLIGKEKQTFGLTTCKIEKARKDKIEQHT